MRKTERIGHTVRMNPVLVCLHGWGGSSASFAELRAAMEDSGIAILTPDLPGFGSEPEPAKPWSVDDYADWVEHWLQENLPSSSPFLLLGHSHGGRIAIKIAYRRIRNDQPATRNLKHLFLCAAAGIPHHSAKTTIGNFLARIGGIVFRFPILKSLASPARRLLYTLLRVHDYEQASPLMRETMKLVKEEDLTPLLPSITIPTDLFWGEDDTMTPISDGKLMHDRIRGSILHTFPNVRHRVHRDRSREIASVIRERTMAGRSNLSQ